MEQLLIILTLMEQLMIILRDGAAPECTYSNGAAHERTHTS